jgi:signal transduction histidine kinase
MVLRVGVARHVMPDTDPRVADVFDDVHRTGTAALADLRRLVTVLRDPDRVRGDAALTAIDPGALPAAMDGAVETARRAGVIVEAEIGPAIVTLDAVRGLALLRLTQEALTNVAKHAGPEARASLRAVMEDADLRWSVSDDGGLRTARSGAPPPGGGHGLTGMRERVAVLGGSLTAGPYGSGWRVATVLPASGVAGPGTTGFHDATGSTDADVVAAAADVAAATDVAGFAAVDPVAADSVPDREVQ